MNDLKDIFKTMAAVLAIGFAALLVVVALVLVFQSAFGPTPEEQATGRVPVAIGAADGCTVYRFVDNGKHYFTRCGETVTTTKNYNEYCGKACTRPRQEQITTEGNK